MSARCRVSRWAGSAVAVVMLRNLTPHARICSTAGDDLVLLDGGLATELERRGHDLSDDLWSARLLLDRPGRDRARRTWSFFAAGARVATTASYQASFEGFAAPRLHAATRRRP